LPIKFVVFTDFLINFSKLQISSSQVGNPTGLTTNTTTQRGLQVRVRGRVREGLGRVRKVRVRRLGLVVGVRYKS
jgi:hypothetical protein